MRKLILLGLVVFTGPAFGWGTLGHKLVARIAESQLTPQARAGVQAILANGETMASVASWADEIRSKRPNTSGWHFVDIPITAPRMDLARDCPAAGCVASKVEDFRKQLADPSLPASSRHEALLFLIHFVGDLHQPLHASDNNDKGGNGVKIQFYDKQTNLHSLWDSGLLARMGSEDELFAALSAQARKKAAKWSKGGAAEWANKTHDVSKKVTYGKLPKVAAGTVVPVSATYERAAQPVIREQLERGGVHLAMILNQIFR
jgi:hypothetical protein